MTTTALQTQQKNDALVEAGSAREVQEVQAMMVIAKRFPRDQKAAIDRIMQACQRPALAAEAVYQYARGGSSISGPSIRLAESIAQNWGNLQFGVREIEQRRGESTVEAFAWDMETNTRQIKVFQVPHIRYSKSGGNTNLTDPRDIYETIANAGARRVRACILGVVPGDVVDEAVAECEKTLAAKCDTSEKSVARLVEAFGKQGITKAMIEARIQRRVDAITPALMLSLIKIGNSIKDGISTPGDWFSEPAAPRPLRREKPVADAEPEAKPEAVTEAVDPESDDLPFDDPVDPATEGGAS